MNLKSTLATALASLFVAAAANATTLTFNGLNSVYGDGSPVVSGMTTTSSSLSYTEGGYVLTLFTPNTYANGAHIGDAGANGTFNWHDDGDNGVGAYVTLTRADGGLFDLLGLNFGSPYGGSKTTVSAAGYSNVVLSGIGASTNKFYGVSSIRFSSTGYLNNQLDNINVEAAVPEPASLALLGAGLLGLGTLRRKSAKK